MRLDTLDRHTDIPGKRDASCYAPLAPLERR